MTPEEFRAAGHALVDWIADHRAQVPDLPVRSVARPGDVRAALPVDPPDGPDAVEGVQALIGDLDRVIVPGLTQIQHPMNYAWFPANASLASVLGDLASSGLGALGISWQSAPALTEVEEVVCDWLRRLTGLDPGWHGAIHDTASTACLVAMLAARERACDGGARAGGLQAEPRPLVVYATDQAHSSVEKAVRLAGFGLDNLRRVPTDPWTRAMLPDALRRAIEDDVAAGRRPAAVVLNVGSTAVTAMDPIADAAAIAREHGLWVHVDAAMAGAVLMVPERRHLAAGLEAAHSFSWNPHKWLGTVADCSLLYVRDPAELVGVMSTDPSYLRSTADGAVTQLRDWGIPLGRRFRALKLWFQLRLDGPEAIRARLRRDLDNAAWLAEQVAAEPGWDLVAPVPLQTVCVRHTPAGIGPDEVDAHTLAWAERVNASGRALLTPALLDGRWMVRVSVGVEATERRHVARLWDLMRAAASGAELCG